MPNNNNSNLSAVNARFCQACPRKLGGLPAEPCPLALERILAIQADPKKNHEGSGCDWYILNSESNYCFWNYMTNHMDGPMSDREIAELLMIPAKEVDKIANSALEKLKLARSSPDVQGFLEAVNEYVANQEPDHTVYLPDRFKDAIATEQQQTAEPPDVPAPDKPKRRVSHSQPLHRSGLRRDIFYRKMKNE